MARILVLCPSHRDVRELAHCFSGGEHVFAFHDFASTALEEVLSPGAGHVEMHDAVAEVERIVDTFRGRVNAVVSTDDYPGSALAAVVADRLGLPGTRPAANLLCQHKYFARRIQYAAGIEGTPAFALLDAGHPCPLAPPCFVKPVKSFFSIGSAAVDDGMHLAAAIARARLPAAFFEPFAQLFDAYSGERFPAQTVLVEERLSGAQVTVEGYADRGEVTIIGTVDSVFHPGTLSFKRFDYPSSLPAHAVERLEAVAVEAVRAMDCRHGLFNVEMIFDPQRESVHVIEINPRMASQFADLYEKVDGVNSYRTLVDLALGEKPRRTRRAGRHAFAVSHALRRFTDALVSATPDAGDIARATRSHPDARVEVLATAGRYLSQELQDGASYRYGIVNFGCEGPGAVEATLRSLMDALPFEFTQIEDRRAVPAV